MEPKPNPSPSEDHGMTRQIDGPDSISQSESSNETIHAGFWSPSTARFPVVCIGMSAGGVAPLQTLIRTLSPKTGMAFVVIHHLRQEHPTLLPAILSSCTSMPVRLAEPGISILPNHIYILPSGQEMNLPDGAFALQPRTKLRGWSNVVSMPSPVWYPNLTDGVRSKLLTFIFGVLDEDLFDPAQVNRYCGA